MTINFVITGNSVDGVQIEACSGGLRYALITTQGYVEAVLMSVQQAQYHKKGFELRWNRPYPCTIMDLHTGTTILWL